ncbi:tripartite motif-containing 59-related [Anaeramoeba flamelloides]|uniref:Tripartite motif-containing 59-related n=1 Tax=Anaeramoeba flamelloides TaxID=1746091 RepID=A0AAV7YKA2_9EUKA|nr:tripartite motif-containing 59-related [Anaeramoeba flamelloides]
MYKFQKTKCQICAYQNKQAQATTYCPKCPQDFCYLCNKCDQTEHQTFVTSRHKRIEIGGAEVIWDLLHSQETKIKEYSKERIEIVHKYFVSLQTFLQEQELNLIKNFKEKTQQQLKFLTKGVNQFAESFSKNDFVEFEKKLKKLDFVIISETNIQQQLTEELSSWGNTNDTRSSIKTHKIKGYSLSDHFQMWKKKGVLNAPIYIDCSNSEHILANWDFSNLDKESQIILDTSGNELHARPVNSPKRTDFGLKFSGHQYCAVNHNNKLVPSSPFSVAILARSTTTDWNHHGFLIGKRSSWMIHPNKGSKNVRFIVWNNDNALESINTGQIKDITAWHWYVGTYDGSTAVMYLDGEKCEKKNWKGPMQKSTGPLLMGRDLNDRFLNGEIAQAMIFDKAFTKKQVKELFKVAEKI